MKYVKRKTDGKLFELVERRETGPRRRLQVFFLVFDPEVGKNVTVSADDFDEDVSDEEKNEERSKIVRGYCSRCGDIQRVGFRRECPREDCPKEVIAVRTAPPISPTRINLPSPRAPSSPPPIELPSPRRKGNPRDE